MPTPIMRGPEKEGLTEENRIAGLLSSIVGDVQRLLRQEIALAKTEFTGEMKRAKAAAVITASGAFAAGIAGVLFGLMVAQAIAEMTDLPAWACSGMAAAIFAGIGIALILRGKESAKDVDLFPKETVENMKENVQWIKNRT